VKKKVIARLVKGGWNEKDAVAMVEKYLDLALQRGCETVKEIADAVAWFVSV
jgi:hypothetical protein